MDGLQIALRDLRVIPSFGHETDSSDERPTCATVRRNFHGRAR